MDYPREGLINIQNIDDSECFKWSIVRYLSPVDHNPRRITKTDNDFAKKLDFKKLEILTKSKKRNPIGISVSGYKIEEKRPSMYQ